MKTVIRGGTVVTAIDTTVADVLIEGERIVAVAAPDASVVASFAEDALIIDATDRYVIPGGIDAHTHFQSSGQAVPVLDTFETGTRAAAFGGTTTIIDFASPDPGERMLEAFDAYQAMTAGVCSVDYGLHMQTFNVDARTPAELDRLVAEGITSFKMFMAYPGALYSDDGQILRVMQHSGQNGSLVMMHAENGIAMDVLREQAVARGDIAPLHHALTRPALLEAEAVHRAAVLARVAGVGVYIVHLSSADALAEVVAARDQGWNVFAETCPQYLFLDIDELDRPDFEGARFVCSPPLRPKEHQQHLWRGLATDDLQVVATDHCPFCWSQRQLGRDDFRAIPNGLAGVEHRLELMFEGVVRQAGMSVNRWVEICSTNPARMFGLHPRKGTIAPGSDADLVLFDPNRAHTISVDRHHMNVDYSVYEGRRLSGKVDKVLLRGRLIIDGDEHLGRPGDGGYLRRGSCTMLR